MIKGLKKLPKDIYVLIYNNSKVSVKKINHLPFDRSYEDELCIHLKLSNNLLRNIMINQYGALLALKTFRQQQRNILYLNELFFKNSTTAHNAIEWVESYIMSQKLNP